MIIESVKIKNVGPIKNIVVPFDPKITCLIGDNGTGKTTVLSSLFYALNGFGNNGVKKVLYYNGTVEVSYSMQDDKFVPIINNLNSEFAITKNEGITKKIRDTIGQITGIDSSNYSPFIGSGSQHLTRIFGYLLSGLLERYPESKDIKKEKAICIFDGIDLNLHPRWQAKILKVLMDNFPQTQFIISTHSPLVVNGLDRGQIVQLKKTGEGKDIDVEPNSVDIWSWSYHDILHILFETPINPSKYTCVELETKLAKLLGKNNLTGEELEEKNSLLLNIKRLKESIEFVDELAKLKAQLEKQDLQLRDLINKLMERKNEETTKAQGNEKER